jgi:hypothetical protein
VRVEKVLTISLLQASDQKICDYHGRWPSKVVTLSILSSHDAVVGHRQDTSFRIRV